MHSRLLSPQGPVRLRAGAATPPGAAQAITAHPAGARGNERTTVPDRHASPETRSVDGGATTRPTGDNSLNHPESPESPGRMADRASSCSFYILTRQAT